TDSDVDAANLLVDVARFPVVLLVDDRVDRNRGLTGLAVTDDQLTLTTADGDHGVDGLDTGLHRLVHTLALHDAGRLQLELTTTLSGDRAKSIDRVAERVHYAAEIAIADGDRENLASAANFLSGLDTGEVAHDDRSDLVLVEVQGESLGTVL